MKALESAIFRSGSDEFPDQMEYLYVRSHASFNLLEPVVTLCTTRFRVRKFCVLPMQCFCVWCVFIQQVTHFPQYGQTLDKQLVAENEELGRPAATACTAANYYYKRPRYASGLNTASQHVGGISFPVPCSWFGFPRELPQFPGILLWPPVLNKTLEIVRKKLNDGL